MAEERRPEVLCDPDGQVMWIPVVGRRWDQRHRGIVPCDVTRGQAKQAAMHEITSSYDWTTLRCTKVWMAFNPDEYDHESGVPGLWMEAPKGTAGAHPYWRVEEMAKVGAPSPKSRTGGPR